MAKSKAQQPSSRPFHITVFGATGFTGRLVAEYLATCADSAHLKWAIAGRNPAKLEECRQAILALNPAANLSLIEADSQTFASLKKMAEQSQVVITTVGPYLTYGEPLARACVEAGTHYVDLTGEPEFVDSLQLDFHDTAEKAGIKIVNSCGFDSIPHDMGAYYTVKQLNQLLGENRAGKVPVKVEGFIQAGGGFSGGTWHSMVNQVARLREYFQKHRAWRQVLDARPSDRRRSRIALPAIKYCKAFGAWAFTFPTIDPQVVRRSGAAFREYGPDFTYGHYVLTHHLHTGLAGAATVGGIIVAAQLEFGRKQLLKVKDPGQGPSPAQRQKSWFKVRFVGEADGMHVWTEVSGGDPGYDETAKMLAESALCLAFDGKRLPPHCGVVTPAAAMGDALLERLQKAGILFRTL